MKKLIKNMAVAILTFTGVLLSAQDFTAEVNSSESGPEQYIHFGLNNEVTFVNGSADTKILSLGVFAATDKNILGIQESLFYSNINNHLTGYQGSGLFSRIGEGFEGAQISGIGNFAAGTSYGAQCSYGFNIAENHTGVQVSYAFNKAQNVRGVQIGLVNVSDNTDYTLGLINIIKDGIHDFGAGVDSNKNIYFQIQEGGKNLYTTIGAGGKLQSDFFNGDYATVFAGLGGRDYLGMFSFDQEFLWKFAFCEEVRTIGKNVKDAIKDKDEEAAKEFAKDFKYYQIPAVRLTANCHLASHFAVFASAEVELRVEEFNDQAFTYSEHKLSGSFDCDGKKVTLYPAFSAGVKIR